MSDANINIDTGNNFHITLQGKGGVGKSLVASLVAQYLKENNRPVVIVDTDPVNATLAGYKSLAVQRLELMQDGVLLERNFDQLIEQVVSSEGTDFVVDNGAASFIPLSYYLIENDVVNLIADSGKQVIIHSVLTGGQAMFETLKGFAALAEQMPEQARIVVWLNEFFGEVMAEGKPFEKMRVYEEHRERVTGIIRITQRTPGTFGKDMQFMLDHQLTFDELQELTKEDVEKLVPDGSARFDLMAKSRMKIVKKDLFGQLATML